MYNPPHAATDREKLNGMIEALRLGRPLPPIVVVGQQAISGSHRIEAQDQARRLWANETEGWENSPEPKLEAIELDDVEVDFDELDFNMIASHVYRNTSSVEIKAALEDQR